MKILGIVAFGLLGSVLGVYLAGAVIISSLVAKTPVDSSTPVLQQDIGYSEGQTKILPDFQVQRAASVQGTVGVE